MAAETIMDAVNAALENEGAPAPAEEEVIEGTEGGEEGTEGADDGAPAEEGTEEGDGAESADGDEPSEEPTREELAADAEKLGIAVRDNGKFKSKEQLQREITEKQAAPAVDPKTGKPIPTIDPKTGKPVEQKAEKKAADPLNDPIDKSLNVKTQERIRTLIDRTKVAEETAQTNQANFDTLIKGVQATGTTPEQYGETLEFLRKVNSNNPEMQATALDELESLADRLATMLGRERKISDPLAMHPDLQTALKGGQITKQFAMETARLRNGTTMRTTMATDAQTAQTQLQQIEAEKTQGKTDLNSIERQLKASDAQYEAKLAQILPAFKIIAASTRPSEWGAKFQQLYKETRIGAPPRRQIPAQQPNRANKSGGNGGGAAPKGGETGPKDMRGALDAALAKLGG